MPSFAPGFRRPTAKAARSAVDTQRVPAPAAIKALAATAAPPPIPVPTSEDDWLAQYVEPGQTMAEFLATCPWLSRRKLKYYGGTFTRTGDTLTEKYPSGRIYVRSPLWPALARCRGCRTRDCCGR